MTNDQLTSQTISNFDSEAGKEVRPTIKFAALSIWWRLAFYLLFGFFIGCAIQLLFSALSSTAFSPGPPQYLEQFSNQHVAVLIEDLIYMLLGAILGFVSEVFNRERVSLGRATAIHALVTTGSLTLAALILHWVPLGWPLLGFILTVLAIFVVIWLTIWVSIARQVARINAKRQST